jgi:hypothetical protein
MHTVVIHQIDQKITSVLKPLRDLGPGTQAVPSGDKVFIQGLNPLVGPKGRMDSQGQFGFRAILAFAHELLSSEASDLVRLQVVFIFHQTSGAAVKGVMDTMRLIRDTGVLPALTGLHGKRLNVEIVNVLSCESAADKAVSPPHVVTYTTGDPQTGGITLNPFAVSFRELDGHFNPDGSWEYNNPDSPDPDGEASGGTIHQVHNGQENTQQLGPGAHINIMGFPPP